MSGIRKLENHSLQSPMKSLIPVWPAGIIKLLVLWFSNWPLWHHFKHHLDISKNNPSSQALSNTCCIKAFEARFLRSVVNKASPGLVYAGVWGSWCEQKHWSEGRIRLSARELSSPKNRRTRYYILPSRCTYDKFLPPSKKLNLNLFFIFEFPL